MPLITQSRPPEFDIGDRPTIVATFRNTSGVLTNPGSIEFKLKDPAGAVTDNTEANATEISVGVWSWQLPVAFTAPGTWKIRVAATSVIQVAEEVVVKVKKSLFAA